MKLSLTTANSLAALPLHCIQKSLPYKPGNVITNANDLAMPVEHHPAFYGCFDWHSAVHGHWSLVYLLKTFDGLAKKEEILKCLNQNLTAENIKKEVAYFSLNEENRNFERPYGWAWLLKLQEELYTSNSEWAKHLYNNIRPLADYVSEAFINYLPKLVYPVRAGTHTNTAFALSFAYDYALAINNSILKRCIEENALRFFENDKNCPINWEPGGYDFLSPCLQELDIMRKVLDKASFKNWLANFLPDLQTQKLQLPPGEVIDRKDGHLVHLDGLNFSRAWCLFSLKNNKHAFGLATQHLNYSLNKITDGNYAGQHWLVSFALYAFKVKNEIEQNLPDCRNS